MAILENIKNSRVIRYRNKSRRLLRGFSLGIVVRLGALERIAQETNRRDSTEG